MEILTDNNVEFIVAPVSAKAQVSHLVILVNGSLLTSVITLQKIISIAFTAIPTFSFMKSIVLSSALTLKEEHLHGSSKTIFAITGKRVSMLQLFMKRSWMHASLLEEFMTVLSFQHSLIP